MSLCCAPPLVKSVQASRPQIPWPGHRGAPAACIAWAGTGIRKEPAVAGIQVAVACWTDGICSPLGRICNTWGVKLGNGLPLLSLATGGSAWAATRQTATLVRTFCCCCCCCCFRPAVIWRLLFIFFPVVHLLLFSMCGPFFCPHSVDHSMSSPSSNHGSNHVAVPVPDHHAGRLHSGQDLLAQALHWRHIPGLGQPDGGRGLLRALSVRGAGGEGEAAVLGHGGPGEVQVRMPTVLLPPTPPPIPGNTLHSNSPVRSCQALLKNTICSHFQDG